ncbi:MAG: sterol desaturase family protein, partial [Planctomycetota bacterium]
MPWQAVQVDSFPPIPSYSSAVQYYHWLILASLCFLILERLFPWRKGQALFRPGWLRDLLFLVVNGHFYGVWTAAITGWLVYESTTVLQGWGLSIGDPIGAWPFWAQLIVAFVAQDFIQWNIHRLLHAVPWLWTFHKVHHAITTMDWIGNFRFHWMEHVVYRSLQWLPLALLNVPPDVLMTIAVAGTFWGHFNHSNLNVDLGPMKYVFNNPRMHLWHHDATDEGGVAKNFGI